MKTTRPLTTVAVGAFVLALGLAPGHTPVAVAHRAPSSTRYPASKPPPLALTITASSPLTITFPNPCCTPGTAGTPYDQNLFVSGGVPPYTWSIAAGHLPTGLSLDCPLPPASFDGVPTRAGTFSFALRVTDGRGTQATEASSLTIQPAGTLTASLSVFPTCVQGGHTVTGTVQLGSVAPLGGAVVGLMSNNPAVAIVPASVTIPAGATRARFLVRTKVVSRDTTVTLIDAYQGQNQFAELSVRVP